MTATIHDIAEERAKRVGERIAYATFFLFAGAVIVWLTVCTMRLIEHGKAQ